MIWKIATQKCRYLKVFILLYGMLYLQKYERIFEGEKYNGWVKKYFCSYEPPHGQYELYD